MRVEVLTLHILSHGLLGGLMVGALAYTFFLWRRGKLRGQVVVMAAILLAHSVYLLMLNLTPNENGASPVPSLHGPDGHTLMTPAVVQSSLNLLGIVLALYLLWQFWQAYDHRLQRHRDKQFRFLSHAIEQGPAAVIITDLNGRVEYVNTKFTKVTGYTSEDMLGKTPPILSSGNLPREKYNEMWDTLRKGGEWRGEFHTNTKDGRSLWEYVSIAPITEESKNVFSHYLITKEDITLRKEYEDQILHQANYDNLTGLPNRFLAIDRLSRAITMAKRDKNKVGLAFVDLDNFKKVNDSLGHDFGDRLLLEASERLKTIMRDSDTIARLGGDEFLVILPELTNSLRVEIVAKRIVEAFSKPFFLDGHEFIITASVGLTIFPEDGDDPQILLKNADAAMYLTKDNGRNSFQFFTPEMNTHALERIRMEHALRHALENQELHLHFQPIINAKTGKVVAAETLMRWHNEELGDVSPMTFIPLAEDLDLIVPLGAWVLHRACTQAKAWIDDGIALDYMTVNVSSRQFRPKANLLRTVKQALEKSGLAPQHLELEVTESLLLGEDSESRDILNKLKELGVRISLDDFGTGYSSLSYLKRYPFDTLKVDRSFVRDVPEDEGDKALIEAIVAMAQTLKLKVVAEGVETEEQLTFLRDLGCELIQGYYFSKPLPTDEFEMFVKKWDAQAQPTDSEQ